MLETVRTVWSFAEFGVWSVEWSYGMLTSHEANRLLYQQQSRKMEGLQVFLRITPLSTLTPNSTLLFAFGLLFRGNLQGGDGQQGGQDHAADAPELVAGVQRYQRHQRIQTKMTANQPRFQSGTG